jgi:hypothetical protein
MMAESLIIFHLNMIHEPQPKVCQPFSIDSFQAVDVRRIAVCIGAWNSFAMRHGQWKGYVEKYSMSFPAYLTNIQAKTGKSPADFRALAEKKGFTQLTSPRQLCIYTS